MSTSSVLRSTPVVPVLSDLDLSDKRGFFYKIASNKLAALANATTDVPFGCVTAGEPAGVANGVAVPSAIVAVKLSASPGTVVKGTKLVTDGSTLGTVKADPGTGARVAVAVAHEAGAADELIEARLIEPEVYAGA